MSVSLNPIGPWPFVAILAAAVTALTIWAYLPRLRSSTGYGRWIAFSLRLLAIVVCFLAALRPTINLPEKKKEPAALVFLLDRSGSMEIEDEVNGQSRWKVAVKALQDAQKVVAEKLKDFEVKVFLFDSELHEEKPDENAKPDGRETAMGTNLLEPSKRLAGLNVATIVLVGDGANNAGLPPLTAADQLKSKLIPVVTVGVGDENAGAGSKDIAIRSFEAGPLVYVKNQPEIRATIATRGFANRPIEVELYVENEGVVDRKTITPTAGSEILNVTGLKYLPQIPGEKRMELRVKPQDGELVRANNSFTTYLTVLKGGLRVRYFQGPNFTWEIRFLVYSLDAAREINVETKVVRQPAIGDKGLIDDADFAPGNYDVFILGDIAAEYLTPTQQKLLANAVDKGAGLMMLGGRSSFGEGGWGNTALAGIAPFTMRIGDGQIKPPGGIKFVPSPAGLQGFVLRLGSNAQESQRVWESLPKLEEVNRFGQPKPSSIVMAQEEQSGQPLMLGMDVGQGRVIAFAGETWPWYRGGDQGLLAHRRFWRQATLWLAHKEDKGENEVKIKPERRRLAVGERLDLSAWARDAKREPIAGAQFQTTVTAIEPADAAKAEPIQLFPQGEVAKGFYFASGKPGEYKVETVATKDGKDIGRDSARFNVYQDDRERENPAADRALLRQIAEVTGGKSVAQEELGKQLATLDPGLTERVSLTEKRIWDNWIFLVIFAAIMSLEWWLRKRLGWV
ncbi:MAG TPA: glutamine amidotransferase [Isosphaeraceae bacterium]